MRRSPPRRSQDHAFGSRPERRDHWREIERHPVERHHGDGKGKSERERDADTHRERDRERESRDVSRSKEPSHQHTAEERNGGEISVPPSGSARVTPNNTPSKDMKNEASHEVVPKPPPGKKKFTNRCRLFVGNLPANMTENDLRELFLKYGAVSEVFVQSLKGFGFVRMDTRANAEKAKEELDWSSCGNRELRVRFATLNCTVHVENLHPMVSNELLEEAFSFFGTVERAVVLGDERGKSLGRGYIDFARRSAALNCVKTCNEGLFILTRTPQPVIVRSVDNVEDEDGILDRSLEKNPSFESERGNVEPRFARPGTFEFEVASQWKALADAEKAQRELLEKQIRDARQQVQAEMDQALLDQQAEQMRRDLQRRQEELERFEDQRRQERVKFLDHQRRLDDQRREEYYQQQEAIFSRHTSGSKAVEKFLRGRHQQLDEMYHQHSATEGPVESIPPSSLGHVPSDRAESSRSLEMVHGAPLPPDGALQHDRSYYDRTGESHLAAGPSGGQDPNQWTNIAAAVTQIRSMLCEDQRTGPYFEHGDAAHGVDFEKRVEMTPEGYYGRERYEHGSASFPPMGPPEEQHFAHPRQ